MQKFVVEEEVGSVIAMCLSSENVMSLFISLDS